MYEYRAQLTRLVDGDTVHVQVDPGLDLRVNLTLRFYGLDAPEMRTAAGVTAKAWVQAWFDQHAPDGLFLLRTVKDKREKFGRYLAVIASLDRTSVLNDDMITAGHAVPYDGGAR